MSLLGKGTAKTANVDVVAVLIVMVFAFGVVPSFLQVTFGIRLATRSVGSGFEPTDLSQLSRAALEIAVVGVVVVALLSQSLRHVRYSHWLVLYMLPCAAVTTSTLLVTGEVGISPLLYVAVGLLVAGHAEPLRLMRVLGVLTALVASLSIVMALVAPDTALVAFNAARGESSKAVIGSRLLAGPLYHPNSLGQMLAFGLPWTLTIAAKGPRRLALAVTVVALLWSGSRTSMLGVAVAIACVLAWRVVRSMRRSGALALPALAIVYVALIPVNALLVWASSAKSFSDRGYIWEGSLDLVRRSPWSGSGVSVYETMAGRGGEFGPVAALAFHAHNTPLHILVISGFGGLAALILLESRILYNGWMSGLRGSGALVMWPVIFIGVGWLEVGTDFYSSGNLSWIIWPSLALALTVHDFNPAESAESNRPEAAQKVFR